MGEQLGPLFRRRPESSMRCCIVCSILDPGLRRGDGTAVFRSIGLFVGMLCIQGLPRLVTPDCAAIRF